MTLAPYVRILGRGPGRSRSLTQEEAQAAMTLMLSGEAAPEAIGALLMLLRMKGEVPAEIAGLALGATSTLPALPRPDLDWPSYAAGRTRGLPWFLLSARLVAEAGHDVLLHGFNGADRKVRAGLAPAGIPVAATSADLQGLMDRGRIAYLPLEVLSPDLFSLLTLRDVLGLRSCINTVCRMLNPAGATASVQGVFHPSYRGLQTEAAVLMGLRQQTLIKGGGGEFECHAAKDTACFGLRDGQIWNETLPARIDDTRRLDDGSEDTARLAALWQGKITDPFAEAVVIATAALALDTLGHAHATDMAQSLWSNRHTLKAA
ncbi:glycosyl transferase family protein [Marinovum sp. 2_MG-2023]|uniref:glycosyl transferase family protein n=1 Tax=unclassified Marinovum TaxID=2647166 RepID=UPI0026E425F3|nr:MULTISPECIES: glycosyl transferase family protein [unclassified Marinovum]MDO6728776.1 glycosyl transferase family protein [Marinovum sp. 2_MG-2023]MDO6777808.1 glycosyl transferase family protein [Marinovum sp. 1_MG-2023]